MKLGFGIALFAVLLSCGTHADNDGSTNSSVRDGFVEPAVWSSHRGVLSGTLVVGRARNRLGDRVIDTLTYNGSIPGPTWSARPGDEISVRLINNANLSQTAEMLPQICIPNSRHEMGTAALGEGGIVDAEDSDALHTNIHTHGLQVDPRGNSDNVYLDIAPGQYFDYRIQIPANQPSGLYFYHPHRHKAVSRQMWNGLAGAIIVNGGIDDLPAVKAAKERLLVVNELLLDGFGQVPAPTLVPNAGESPFHGLPPVPTEIHFPVNGVLEPQIAMRPGEIQRWRIVNASAHRYLDLAIEDQPADAPNARQTVLHQIAQDGVNFGVSVDHTDILMAPANRIEIMVQIAEPGTYYLKALPYDQGHPGGPRPLVTLATVTVEGRPVHPPTTFPLTLIPPQEDALVQQASGSAIDPTAWSGEIETKPIAFFLDGEQFDPDLDRPGNRDVTAGFSEEWTLENDDVFQHPFHIHINPFQVLVINGQPTQTPRPWWDTLRLPPCQVRDANGNCAAPGTVKLLMTFRPDKIGKTVYHCHIIPHEDAGMMAVFELQSGGLPVTIPPVGPFDCAATPGACRPFTPAEPEFTALDAPYVFTQFANQHGVPNPVPAAIAIGGNIQLQLPGNSDPGGTRWTVTLEGDAIAPGDVAFVPSVGQFRLADGIYEFNFKAAKKGP